MPPLPRYGSPSGSAASYSYRRASIIGNADPEVAARLIEALYDVDLRPDLSNLAVPALIVHGALDALPGSSPDGARAAAELIPNCELAMLDDAGHVPTLTRPEAVAEAIAAGFDAAR